MNRLSIFIARRIVVPLMPSRIRDLMRIVLTERLYIDNPGLQATYDARRHLRNAAKVLDEHSIASLSIPADDSNDPTWWNFDREEAA